MYQYERAVVKHRQPDVRFEEIDVQNLPVKTLLAQYEETYIVLSHPSIQSLVTLVLSAAETFTTSLLESVTVVEWLQSIGNLTLPTQEGVPEVTIQHVLARDAWQAGYTVDISVPSGNPYNDASDYDKTDLWLRRDGVDYRTGVEHMLATVNGIIHRMDADNNGIYIKDGTETFRRTGNAFVGLISFAAIGKVYTASITPDMIYNPDPTRLYSDKLYIKVPFSTDNKILGVVIGGYLHLATNELKVIGDRAISVDMKRIPLLERYMESRHRIDMTSMERFHEVSEQNVVDYDLQGFYSNECMLELMTLSQSFIVAIEADHLNSVKIPLERTYLPGRFYHNERPLYPLMTELGRMPSYLSEEESGKWVIRIDRNMKNNYFHNTTNFRWNDKVNERRTSGDPFSWQRGSLIDWYRSILEIK